MTKDQLLASVRAKYTEIDALISAAWGPDVAPTPPPSKPPAPASGIAPADILHWARANVPFAGQNWWAQANGKDLHTNGKELLLPETGIHGSKLQSGETLRFGKQTAVDGKPALVFQLAPGDPLQNGSHRAELELLPINSVGSSDIEHDKVYWFGYRLWVNDWGTLPANDEAFIGLHIHGGASQHNVGPSGSHGLVVYGKEGQGRSFRVWNITTTLAAPTVAIKWQSDLMPIKFGQWVDVVAKFNQSQRNGFFQMWLDGVQIVNRPGPFGLGTVGVKDYMKAGLYNWSGTTKIKKVMLRNVVVAQDQGGKYGPEAFRAFVNQ